MRIDCHTHIISDSIAKEYFERTDNVAIVMEMANSIMQGYNCIDTVLKYDKLLLSPVIDLKKDIPPQLERIRERLDDWKVVGIKLFLTYQKADADDGRLFEIYDFAEKYNLGITFHTGLPSLVLPSDNYMEGSTPKRMLSVAQKYPKVNFVAAHLCDPDFNGCIDVMSRVSNIYSDFSGAYETGTKEASDIDKAVSLFKEAILSRPGMEHKILYGTDFCPPINLSQLDEYDYTIDKIFEKKDFDLIYFKNALKAFPRISSFIGI